MKIFTLPAEIEVLDLDQISDLIADALCPIESDDAEGLGYQLLRIDVDKEVTQDARAGLLPIRHPLTRKLQTTPTPTADILDRLFQPTPFDVRYGVVMVADAAAYVAERGITLLVQTTDQTEAVKPASDAPEQSPATPAPVVAESSEQRRARWLDWYGKGERGAVQRVHTRELLTNPKADRSFIGKEIAKAKQEKEKAKRGGSMFSQLVQDGKRQN